MCPKNMKQKNFDIDNLPKENPFKVPERYFESLPKLVMDRVHESDACNQRDVQTAVPLTTVPLWKFVATAAAVVAFVGTAGLFLYQTNNRTEVAEAVVAEFNESELDYAMINNSEIELYLAEAE